MSSETSNGYYYDDDKVNDSISIGNFLWLATGNGVIKINQTTRERTEYTTDNSKLPANAVESIAANQKANIWIGTYGNRMAFMNEETQEWEDVPYELSLFKGYKNTIEEGGKVLLGGDKDNWLRTNFIHFDANDTLWVGTSIGLLKLQHEAKKPIWKGPFNPIDRAEQALNVLFIRDVEGGIEISGNFGKRGYEKTIGDIKTYRLPNVISAKDTNWRAMTEEVITEDKVVEEITTH